MEFIGTLYQKLVDEVIGRPFLTSVVDGRKRFSHVPTALASGRWMCVSRDQFCVVQNWK